MNDEQLARNARDIEQHVGHLVDVFTALLSRVNELQHRLDYLEHEQTATDGELRSIRVNEQHIDSRMLAIEDEVGSYVKK